ncbi:molecular chaperone HtpG [Eisenibacter elegans]|jgi:molecular chaperone HtpG|uniref:molecular chaperone HtpG n=1 Tax=Eisenibacter elegans TaxID=997 RepID=UPI0004163170|nr:molecular chaperone HtpG [Eisenibacter elegans]
MQEKGTISVNTENIFPIIKKFLYSDQEIFLRELVSNAMDATQKLKGLASLGEYKGELGELKVRVSLNAEAKTITISDNGLGMTAEEIKKYINQVAFSGATEFVEKYQGKTEAGQIIGHFGLGFYSAFMVAEKVRIVTQSYQEGTEAAQWECDGSTSFEISPAVKAERGTDVILHIAEDAQEFLDQYKLKSILQKYGKFLPIPLYFEEEQINNTAPLWTKTPTDLKDEDYLNFYKELYPFSEEPLFWIHLNVDYPFNLTGILYFPKIKSNLDLNREKIQLYSRQVFITDEVKDIVPEFLQLMHGIIDSPDIPLNVSRSYLQADSNVKKINNYITRKVADKLSELFREDRKAFEEKWQSIGLFVKYGIITEEKFFDKAKNFTLVRNTEEKLFTLDEYREHVQATQTDKNEQLVWLYSSDAGKQSTYIASAKRKGYDVLLLNDAFIDNHFVSALEGKLEKTSLKRVDADTVDKLIEQDTKLESVLSEAESTKLQELYAKVLNNKQLKISVEAMPTDELPVVITLPEFMRRMQEMAAAQGMGGMMGQMPPAYQVAINGNHPLNQSILAATDEAQQQQWIKQAYDLALLSQGQLSGEALQAFIERSVGMIQ